MPQQIKRFSLSILLLALALVSVLPVWAGEQDSPQSGPPIFARIGDEQVAVSRFEQYVQFDRARRFYHGARAVDAHQQAQWIHQFVDRILLLQEATRRALRPKPEQTQAWLDEALVSKHTSSVLAMSLSRLPESERQQWASDELALAALRSNEAQKLNPDLMQIRQYYDTHREKFTMPEQLGISMILLEVAPYAPSLIWDQTNERAQQLYAQLTQGASFEDLALAHSSHASGRNGGNVGLIHAGMLSDEIQATVASLQPGQIGSPQVILQGVVIVRVNERRPPRLSEFESVSARARDLLLRDMGDAAWRDLLRHLRQTVSVVLNSDKTAEAGS